MMDIPKIEAEAGEHAERVLELMGERDGEALESFLQQLTRDQLRWVLYALGAAVIGLEKGNARLLERNRVLGLSMSTLLEDREKVVADLASVTEDRENQARMIGKLREKEAHGWV